jgi:hypothetical protein
MPQFDQDACGRIIRVVREHEARFNDVSDSTPMPVVPDEGVIIGKLDDDLSPGESATVSVWGGDGGEEEDTEEDIEAWDWIMLNDADPIESGTKVICQLINGVWYVVQASCPAS